MEFVQHDMEFVVGSGGQKMIISQYLLNKVRKFHNECMKSSHCPKIRKKKVIRDDFYFFLFLNLQATWSKWGWGRNRYVDANSQKEKTENNFKVRVDYRLIIFRQSLFFTLSKILADFSSLYYCHIVEFFEDIEIERYSPKINNLFWLNSKSKMRLLFWNKFDFDKW